MVKPQRSARINFDLNRSKKATSSRSEGRNRSRLTAGILIALYGYEVVAMPLLTATARISDSEYGADASVESVYTLYLPQPGESQVAIAQRFGVDASELASLRAQMTAKGWLGRAWLVPKQSTSESSYYPGYVLYTLKEGERLGSLALRVNRSARELTRINSQLLGASVVAQLKVGDVVVLPAPQGKLQKEGGASDNEGLQAEQRLAQTFSQAAQSYQASQDSDVGVKAGDVLSQQMATSAGSILSREAEELLSSYGRAKVGVRSNAKINDVDIELDYLHPLLENNEDILFGQVGARTFDERNITNAGFGYRKQINPNLLVGGNAFVDQDLSNSHTRGGVGVEVWTERARFAANAYMPLSDWKESRRDSFNTDPERYELYERAASGWDARMEFALPGAPKLAGTVKYFQWKGDGVDVFGGSQLERNPKGYSIGAKWQPIPLVGFTAEHQKIQGAKVSGRLGLTLAGVLVATQVLSSIRTMRQH
ncbi:inverse autotransporter beta domain-containing protein [Pseudomonas peli]|uniref:inverse autotransporter beta domain-containing protein n=1 Tax=Pseudomonas peli TaxID=592361 RepID=UPI0024ADC0D4|nr:inverse autotransporter beta domain-containing protein [Pseudomonas peli]